MKYPNLLGLATVAVAMLLMPNLVDAHSGTGPCVDCHTMHNSQNGIADPNGPQSSLLKFSCVGCHTLHDNGSNGRATTGVAAPQVFPLNIPPVVEISGGYFRNGAGEHGMTHNVAELFVINTGADSLMTATGATTSPGGSFAINNGSGAPSLVCTSCHDQAVGHAAAGSLRAGTAVSSYRMLGRGGQYVAGQGDVDFEAGAGHNQYDAASMDLFCAKCHGLFHGAAGTGSSGAWIRHPTEVSTNTYAPANYTGLDKVVPVGNIDTNKYYVMCLSCHRPHGNANLDMLRFGYNNGADNLAGDAGASQGCETCHGVK